MEGRHKGRPGEAQSGADSAVASVCPDFPDPEAVPPIPRSISFFFFFFFCMGREVKDAHP
jgi:hypothetical protein